MVKQIYRHAGGMVVIDVRRENFMALFLFIFISWGILYCWLYLIHSIGEKVSTTILSPPFIPVLTMAAFFAFMTQRRAGALKYFIGITLGMVLVFMQSVFVFNLCLNIMPGFNDFIFYYECFALFFFCATPMHLVIRMI